MNIKKVGVLGCGLMGSGIAQVAATTGFDVTVLEVEQSPVVVVRPFELVGSLRQLPGEQPRLDEAGVTAVANALLSPGAGTPVRTGQVPRWR